MKYFEIEFKIEGAGECLQDARDILAAMAGEAGFETFEDTDNGLKGYVQTELFDEECLIESIADFPFDHVTITYDKREAEYRDWNEQWEMEGFEPIVVENKCVIHDGRHLPENMTDSMTVVEIDAKLAFGTGTHETTRMIVGELANTDLTGKSILDCGCGTGILGIVALKRGAERAMGYDIDEWSVDNTRHNAVINRVDERYTPLLGDAKVLDNVEEKFDIVVANINRNILLNDMERFAEKMKDGGILLLSGFYSADTECLKEKAASLGLSFIKEKIDNDWAMLSFFTPHYL